MLEYLKQLKEDPLVYYIYQTDFSIYGIPQENKSYIVVVEKDFTNIQPQNKNNYFKFYLIEDWFKMVLENDILAWKCSCLNKKFKIKEHVKLTFTLNPIKLRQQALDIIHRPQSFGPDIDYITQAIKNLSDIKLINQILEHHKIVNFNELLKDYKTLSNCCTQNEMFDVYMNSLLNAVQLTHKLTDDLYNQYIINRFK